MLKSRICLEQAIIEKATREPAFMAKLLQDPFGFLKGLAGSRPPTSSKWLRRLGTGKK